MTSDVPRRSVVRARARARISFRSARFASSRHGTRVEIYTRFSLIFLAFYPRQRPARNRDGGAGCDDPEEVRDERRNGPAVAASRPVR